MSKINRFFVNITQDMGYNGIGVWTEDFPNTVSGEAEMRARIHFLSQDYPNTEIQIIYGEDVTDQIMDKRPIEA